MADKNLDALTSRARLSPFTEDDKPSAFTDTVAAAFALTRREEISSSASQGWEKKVRERAKKIGELGGDERLAEAYSMVPLSELRYFHEYEQEHGLEALKASPRFQLAFGTGDTFLQFGSYELVSDYARRFPGQVLDDQALFDQMKGEYSKLRVADQQVIERGGGFAGFVGSAGGVMTDPTVLATAPFGVAVSPAKTAIGTIGKAALAEGGVAMITEIPVQAQVSAFKRDIESPWSFANSAVNVLSAGAGGAFFGGTIAGGVIGYKRALGRYREWKALNKAKATPEMDEAERALEEAISSQEQNPLMHEGGAELLAADIHAAALERAQAQADAGQQIDVANVVAGAERPDPVNAVISRSSDPGQLLDIDPLELKVDAKTFQFKGGGDAQGVIATLRDVDRFDRRLAGVALIWERADGARFIADGHQRLALAQRALAAGQDPAEVRLNGFLLREADGITAADARRMAAVKNMAEGSGSALDAAKILRDIGPAGEALLPPLPPRSALVKDARGLANLGEEQFLQVVNGVIDARAGALVGAATPDPKLQAAMIEVLRRANPANEAQARSIVEQVRAQGLETRTTEDLFGEQSFSESLYLERAQVLDAALKLARQDRVVFGGLVRNEATIAGAGANRLDRAANLARQQEAVDAAHQITVRANAKGPLSDALAEAARKVRDGAKPGTVAKAFLEAARREILQGDPGRSAPGAARPIDTPSEVVAADTAEAELWAKIEKIDARQVPALETLSRQATDYVEPSSSSVMVPIGALLPGKPPEPAAWDNALKRFAAAAQGEIPKRKPIKVGVNEAGQLYVIDGNGTVGALRRMGVTEVPAELEIPKGRPVDMKKLAPQNGPVVWAGFIRRQAGQTVEELYQVAEGHQKTLAREAQAIADELGDDVELLDPGIKSKAATEQKLVRKGYNDAGEIVDVVRLGFIARVPEVSRQIIQRLAQKFELLDEGVNVTGLGYLDHKAVVRFPDGRLAEIQIWDAAMAEAKNGPGHALYEEMRAMTPEEALTPEGMAKADAIVEQSKELYAGAIAAANPEWRRVAMMALPEDMRQRVQAAVEAGAGSGGAPGNISRNAARASSTPDSSTSKGTTRAQAEPPAGTKSASSPPAGTGRTTAGRDSQLKNLSAIDSPPRSIIQRADDPRSAQPTKSRTGTVEDADYDAVMSQYQDLLDQRGATLRVANEVDGVLTERSAGAVLDELDTLEETLERVRVCSIPARAS